jgi:diadenosine tetraphosphatase ApaH/serine/threonine PP2A family protein phosphatase
MNFLAGISSRHQEGDVLYVHGSPQIPLCGWVFPWDMRKMSEIGTKFDRVCFTGNTGIPGVFVERGWFRRRWEFFGPEDCVGGFRVVGRRVICNVGAVGYPRDGDWRACYVLFDGETIWFRRVEYDVEATIRKGYAIPTKATLFRDGLREGRA